MEKELLLFDAGFPCWDEETCALADGEPRNLEKLAALGLLSRAGGGYVLTPEGDAERLKLAGENFIPASPIPAFDAEKSLWRNKLYQLMDRRAFTGLFPLGVKEYTVNENLPYAPALGRGEMWTKDGAGRTRYVWPEHPLVKSFIERFPLWGLAARGVKAPGRDGLLAWLAASGAREEIQRFELVLRYRYDFQHYRENTYDADDIFRIKNANRFFFIRTSDKTPEEIYDIIGRLHLFLLAQRRVYIPGYAMMDSELQENQTMAVLAADTEEELAEVKQNYARDGKNLISPVMPLFIIGTSLERLRTQREPQPAAYDWFCLETEHIVRADV